MGMVELRRILLPTLKNNFAIGSLGYIFFKLFQKVDKVVYIHVSHDQIPSFGCDEPRVGISAPMRCASLFFLLSVSTFYIFSPIVFVVSLYNHMR